MLFDGEPQQLTKHVQDRTFLVSAPSDNLRVTLSKLIKQKEVLDGVIQGNKIRIMLAPNTTLKYRISL